MIFDVDNLLLHCRKPRLSSFNEEGKDPTIETATQLTKNNSDSTNSKNLQTSQDSNVDAQRKVAISLLTMSRNEVRGLCVIEFNGTTMIMIPLLLLIRL